MNKGIRTSSRRRNRRLKEPVKIRARRFFLKAFKLFVVAAALPAIIFSIRAVYHKLLTAQYLSIKTINVTGLKRLTKEEVLDASGLHEGDNLLSFGAGDVIQNVKKNPWVSDATLKRGMPDTVNINIVERQPLALIRLNDLYIMDRSGAVFKKLSSDDGLDLPLITGLTMEGLTRGDKGLESGVMELITILENRHGFDINKVSEIHADPVFGLSVITLDEGVRLDVGMDNFEEKLASFEKIIRARGGLGGIEALDINNYREVVVRFTTNIVGEGGDAHGQKG